MAEDWTVLKLLRWTEDYFREKGIVEPRLDAQVLLADLLALDRVGLYLNYDRPLTPAELSDFRHRVARRGKREPLQYITGRAEFWSLQFKVAPEVLIPRADTEILIEEALRLAPAAVTALDIGTGSGALAVALACELPAAITAIDLSCAALALAAENAAAHAVSHRISFVHGDLADLPAGPFALIVANPPYIPSGDLAGLMPEVRDFEPHLALDGGADGLDAYRHVIRQAPQRLSPGGWLLVEVGIGQSEAVREMFLQCGLAEVFIRADYAGIPRVIGGAAK